MGHKTFEQLVSQSWSSAVSTAADNLDYYRPQIMEALASDVSDERSAAVAALREGNDADSHDAVAQLLTDPDYLVRREAAEYLEDLGTPRDAALLLDQIRQQPDLRLLLSRALQSITGRDAGLIDEEAAPDEAEKEITAWKDYLTDNGYL